MDAERAARAAAAPRYVLFGDGESPHLLKWARAFAQEATGIELWAASSRGFAAGFDEVVPPARRLALGLRPAFAGGNVASLRALPAWAGWLRQVQPRWVNAHYLSSHGSLAWLARRLYGLRFDLVASAWGSDVLVGADRSRALRWLTVRVLRGAVFSTSDSRHMAERMQQLGAGEVMTFPFGLETLPPAPAEKDDLLCFANRGLEPVYAPQRVMAVFAALAQARPAMRLVVAHDGSQRDAMAAQAASLGLAHRVRFVGRLDAQTQASWYARARWYLSLPTSDSVSVSVLEALAHGCLPVLSDLPANRELVRDGVNGLLLPSNALPTAAAVAGLLDRADAVARDNRGWVAEHALLAPCMRRFVARLDA